VTNATFKPKTNVPYNPRKRRILYASNSKIHASCGDTGVGGNAKNRNMERIHQLLRDKGIQFDNGLTTDEIKQIETKFDFLFPPDLKRFLQLGLPISKGFINWRQGLNNAKIINEIESILDWPLEGMLFDLKNNDFWVNSWGDKPANYEEKEIKARQKYLTFPKLIPIYGHRYIPTEPMEEGNPVFSVYQMDIVYYGFDLATYFTNEFHLTLTGDFEKIEGPKKIRFWSDWIDGKI